MGQPSAPDPRLPAAVCHYHVARDIGRAIDLEHCQRIVGAQGERPRMRHTRPAPSYFQFDPPPLRLRLDASTVELSPFVTRPYVEVVLYDFGAVSMIYGFELDGGAPALLDLSCRLAEPNPLLEDSHRRLEALLRDLRAAVTRPGIAEVFEDYAVFEIPAVEAPEGGMAALIAGSRERWAQILRSERRPLSSHEIDDAVSNWTAFGADDAVLIDWNAALVFDRDASDILAVLDYANVVLLEMRLLDGQLDDALDRAYAALTSRHFTLGRAGRRMRLAEIGQMEVDGAVVFESVNNALKLLGDPYLARLYRQASQRFRLSEWNATILRKLDTIESIYEKLYHRSSNRRLEALEWIIILLIALSIVLPFVGAPGY